MNRFPMLSSPASRGRLPQAPRRTAVACALAGVLFLPGVEAPAQPVPAAAGVTEPAGVPAVGSAGPIGSIGPDLGATPPPQDDPLARALFARIDAPDPAWMATPAERELLHRLYRPGAYAPLWTESAGQPGRPAADALSLLTDAAEEGLDPADYRPAALAERLARLRDASMPGETERAALDVELSLAVLRYLHHLHRGRVDPAELGLRVPARADDLDFAAWLQAALDGPGLAEAAATLAPTTESYRRLRAALARYRALAADPALGRPLALGAGVRPGERLPGAAALRRRLTALGDLPAGAAVPPARAARAALYDAALVEGVRSFQRRHGLRADGVLGLQTREALAVPLAQRVRQIELALERLRWLPRQNERPYLSVNIPMFRLAGWDPAAAAGGPAVGMDVIVGGALDTQTPVFAEEMRYVVFRPYWNVPHKIARDEIVPRLLQDPQHLARQQMEIVRGWSDAAPVVAATPANIELLRQGRGGLRMRQRPGPHNSLGLVKFIFPNQDAVYLHGTPAPRLFGRTRRDLSHGCVRVQDPVALAQWVLRDQPEWTRERIEAAMAGGRPLRVNLTQPVQVLLYYYTADVGPQDDTVRFAPDIYGHDARLEQALQARQRRS